MLEVDSFSHKRCQALSSSSFSGESLEMKLAGWYNNLQCGVFIHFHHTLYTYLGENPSSECPSQLSLPSSEILTRSARECKQNCVSVVEETV